MLKPFEKSKKKENAVDEVAIKNKDIKRELLPQSAKIKNNSMNFGNYSKFGKKVGSNLY